MFLNRWFTLPNLFSEFRIVAAPFLLLLAWHGLSYWFLALLALALLSDAIDGYLARRMGETSELGAQLDTWGDLTIFLIVPLAIWWLWPNILIREAPYILVALSAYLLPMLVGFIKFKQLPSYHTWAAKTAVVMMSISIFTLLLFDYPWLFRVFALVQILVAIEEIAITLTLRQLRNNVFSYWHARHLTNNEINQ
ncbi:MAG: CDP-alcohol phosphatidyltransferase family protein [Gammaproteobacteria bacterium]|nr:CDP-alcohol phosphatidyltransferase family protein [Gammaproteobacteria bacterium]